MRNSSARRPARSASAASLGLDGALHARGVGIGVVGRLGEHRRVDGERAEARDPDAAVGVGHGQPLGQGQGGVLGDAVGGADRIGGQRRARRRRHQVPLAALDHRRQQRLAGVQVRHDVHPPQLVPHVGPRQPVAVADPGVRVPQVDGPVAGLGLGDGRPYAVRGADVGDDADPADLLGQPGDVAGDVDHGDAGALGGEAAADGLAEATRPTGDDGDPPGEPHHAPPVALTASAAAWAAHR